MRCSHLWRNLLAQRGLTDPRGLLVCAPLSSLGTARPVAAEVPVARPDSGGDVAQLGERLVRNEEVVGSIPIISTNSSSTVGQAQRNPDL